MMSRLLLAGVLAGSVGAVTPPALITARERQLERMRAPARQAAVAPPADQL